MASAVALAVLATLLPATAAPAFAASCTITGTNGNDVLVGTDGADVICGGGGADRLDGAGGDDTLYGGTGNDVLAGGDGDDVLSGETEKDTLFGQAGKDALSGGVGADTLDGGDGDDALDGGNESDTLLGGGGNDRVDGVNGLDTLDGGEGNDILDGGNDADTLQGGLGNDALNGRNGADVLDGGPGDDQLAGENDSDTIYGGFGSDKVGGGNGNDHLSGGPGNDALNGNNGKNKCDGGTGTNVFVGCSTTVNPGGPDPEGEWADTDTDGAADVLELRAGTDLLKADTDGDGLSDGAELSSVTDPTRRDTDADGVADGLDDTDGDGLTNTDELGRGTKAGDPDTDRDSTTDGHEVAQGTDPLTADTDQDTMSDSDENALGTSPTVVDTDGDGISDGDERFTMDLSLSNSTVTYEARGLGRAVLFASLAVPDDERFENTPGQRAPPVEIYAPEALEPGTLTIPFNTAGIDPNAELAVLQFDEETQTFRIASAQSVDIASGIATVRTPIEDTTDSLARVALAPADQAAAARSQFLVVDVNEFEQIWADEITTPREASAELGDIDVVLTLDSSGSMSWNDPTGVRRVAAKSFVDALTPADRAGVVDFDSDAHLLQPLTNDLAAVKDAIDLIDADGGTNLSAGLDTALDELDANGNPGQQRVIVFLTDGDGTYYEQSATRAAGTDTIIFTVGLGQGTDTSVLSSIAAQTGGKFFYVPTASDLPDVFDLITNDPGEPDTDGDGLADTTETKGWRDGSARIFRTDPATADTDGDGMTDGDEAGDLVHLGGFGQGSYFRASSDPTRSDTDRDGLGDLAEAGHGTSAWKADLDRDGLTDSVEVETHSTEPFISDMDADGYSDPWEITHATEGFDPLLFDYVMTPWEYAGDFSRGSLCGDIRGVGGFCEGQSLAYLAGNIGAGFIAVGDVRDLIANLFNADIIAAGINLASLIPIAGDAASIVAKTIKFVDNADTIPSGSALRAAMKDINTSNTDKLKVLRAGGDAGITKLKNAGITDAAIIRLGSRAISPKHFNDMIDSAAQIRKGGDFYRLEKGAEQFLRANTPGALPNQILTKLIQADGTIIRRFYDVLNAARVAKEVKHGRAYGVGRAGGQLHADVALRAGTDAIARVEWHFFPSANGTIGPDQGLLDLLIENNIPYTIWIP